MIEITDKTLCSGCTACRAACPKSCISMRDDAEGFKYPVVDLSLCIHCDLCERVCPLTNPNDGTPTQSNVVAAINSDSHTRAASSSGGIFSLLAADVVARGGVVYGCIVDADLHVKHVAVETAEELTALRSSKYVQSDMSDIFRAVKQQLTAGREVLFSGVPCQVSGLRRFLRKDYPNLLTVDVLCHGVPSPKLYGDWIASLEQRYKAKAVSVNFRDKRKGWKRLFVEVCFDNGRRYFRFSGFDPYMSMFLNNRSQRPSCFKCPFNSLVRPGDISLGDFWGIGRRYPQLDDDKGITLLLVNSERGQNAFDAVAGQCTVHQMPVDLAVAGNKVLATHLPGIEKRDAFYELYTSSGYQAAVDKCFTPAPWWKRRYYDVMRFGIDIVRKVLKKGY